MLRTFWSFRYIVARCFGGMFRAPLIQLSAIGTTSLCMILLGALTLAWQNLDRIANHGAIDVPMTVYMEEGVSPEQTLTLANRIAELESVSVARRVSPEEAKRRMLDGLGEQGLGFAQISARWLPDTIELEFRPGTGEAAREKIRQRAMQLGEVEEVVASGSWVEEARSMVTTLQALAIALAVVVSMVCIAIVSNTIRLGIFARRTEIQILRLVGGTMSFVRGPFLIEGALQGLLGVALALMLLSAAFTWVRPWLEDGLSIVLSSVGSGSIHFFGPAELLLALCFGMLLGTLGARSAAARYVTV